MSKKHFIRLADYIRGYNTTYPTNAQPFSPRQVEHLADYLREQNPRFNRTRWLAYIAGECGPNGGVRKSSEPTTPSHVG